MSRRVREPLPKLPLAPRGRSARRSLSSGPTESRNWVSCAEGLCKPIAGPQVGFQGLLLTSRRDGDERKGAEELLAAVTRIRMRQTSRERTKQAAIRAPRTPKEAPAGPPPSEGVVRTLEDCRATLKQFLSSRPVGAAGLDEVAFLCGCAFEGMDADLCVEAVNSFGQAIARASQAALRSSSSAGACAMFASVLRHPEESCRRAATTEAQKQLDAQQLLRAIGQGVGGKEPCRRLTASASLLQAVRLLVSRPEALDRLRASDGFRLAVEAWKQGTHIPEVAQECCALMLQLASQHARAAAAAGAAECALSSWQRCGTATDLSLRAALVHGFAEVSCLCLPFFPEKPQVLCRLACESLRALLSSGPEPVIFALLKARGRRSAMTGALDLSFGFSGPGDEDKSELKHQGAAPDRCAGLGQSTGGQLARSCLGLVGAQTLKDIRAGFQAQAVGKDVEHAEHKPLGVTSPSNLAMKAAEREATPTPVSPAATPRATVTEAMFSFSEPRGMWYSLLVNDMCPPPQEDLNKVISHRWTFQGALELAAQGKSICYFILCLLEIQRNIQMDQEDEALHPSLLDACKTFVRCQCREGKMGEMYQVLTHFISNSLIFFEWERFLNDIFQDSRAHQERFLVMHLEQVWTRYKRLKEILETMFDYLDANFIWRHRLPKVGELVRDHMRRRCFASALIAKNELFSSAQAGRDETLKQVKFTMGFVT